MSPRVLSSFAGRGASERRSSQSGFTLLELILAIAIGAIILLVINGTFVGALRLHNTTHAKIDEDLVLQRTLGIIRKDFAGIMVPANPQATISTLSGQLSSDAATISDLDNTAERVTPDLYTSSGKIDGWSPYAEVQMVSYYLSPANDGTSSKNLVRVVTRNLLSAIEPTAETQTLLPGVSTAAITFFDGQSWLDTWDSTTTSSLPTAIKFSLVLTARETNTRADLAPIELIVPVLVKTATTLQQEAAAAAQI